MPRTWHWPPWTEEQSEIALKRGWAMVRNYSGTPSFVKLIWRNTFAIKEQEDRDIIVRMEIDGKTYRFDAEELRYWLKYA